MNSFLRLENRHNGEILRMHRRHDAEGRIVLFLDGTLPPKADGPPLHVHVREREEGIVKAGTLGARVGGEKIVVPTGGTVVLPAGVRHHWWNAGDDLLEFSGRAVPAVDLDRFLQALFAFSTPAPTAGHRSSISRTCSGAIGTPRCLRSRLQPFSGFFSPAFFL